MKRFTALHFTALTALWLGHASTCAALPEPDSDIAKCNRVVEESLKSDLKDPRAGGALFVRTKSAELLYSFDDSAQELVYPHLLLLENAAENKRKPRVSNAQSKEAENILEKGQYFDFIRPSIISVGLIGSDDPDIIKYKCIFDLPTVEGGSMVTTLYPREAGEQAIKSLDRSRSFFNKVMSWAKKVNRLQKKVPTFERRYNRAERKLRATVAKLPERLYVVDYIVPRK